MKHLCPKCQQALRKSANRCDCGWESIVAVKPNKQKQSSQAEPIDLSPESVSNPIGSPVTGPVTLNLPSSGLEADEPLPMAIDLRLTEAKKLIAAEAYLKALACLNRALADSPSERLAECMSLKGFLHYQLGEAEKAEQACTVAIEGNWEDPNTFAWRAASRGEQNKWRLAFNDLHRACELTAPDSDQYLALMDQYSVTAKEYFHEQTKKPSPSADVFSDRAWMYLRQSSLVKAERDFKLALSIEIDHRWAALGLAKTHHQAGVTKHLESLLLSAVHPDAPVECRRSAYELSARINHHAGLVAETDFNLHQLYRLAGDDTRQKIQSCRIRAELGFPIRAMDTLTKILEGDPEAMMGWLVRGECHTAVKSYVLAVQDFTRFLNVHSDHVVAMLGRASALLAMKRFSFVHEDVDRVLELVHDHYDAVLLRAKTLLAEDRLNDALAACELATRLETLPEAFAVKAEVYHKLCNFSESFEDYSRAIEFSHDGIQKAEYLYRRGAALYELENFDDAHSDFKKSSQLRPNHAGCWIWKAAAGARLEKWHSAITALKTAIDVHPSRSDAYHKLGRPVAVKVIKHFDRLEKQSPKTPKLHYYRALAHQFLEDHEKAVHDFSVARRRDSSDLNVLVARAQSLAELEDHELARADLKKVIQKDPNHHAARYVRANSLMVLGMVSEALADLNKAIEVEPNCAKYHILLGQLYLQTGHKKKATRAFDTAIVQEPTDAHTYHQRANVFLSMKRYRRAIRDFSHAIELEPVSLMLEQRGQAYLQNGQPELALEDFEAALALNPMAVKAYRGRATVLVNRGKHEQVLIWLTKALHRFEDSNELAELLLARGKVFAQLGRWSPAILDFTSVVDLVRHDTQMLLAARHARGSANLHSGRNAQALSDFERIKVILVDDEAISKKAPPQSIQQINQILNWLEQVEAKPGLPLPAVLGAPIKLKPPTRPPVIRKGVVLDDVTVERLQIEPPFSTWLLQTAVEKEYGPVHFGILRNWLDEGRIDIGAKVLRADWSKWRDVEEVFSDMLPDDEPDVPLIDTSNFRPI